MITGIIVLVLLFAFYGLFKALAKSANKNLGAAVENSTLGIANLSKAAPISGTAAALSIVANAQAELQERKEQLGCTDPNITTVKQLEDWAVAQGLF